MTSHIFVMDRSSERQFLVVMGSDLCVYAHMLIPRRKERVNYDLCAAYGTTIHTYGWLSLRLNLGLCWHSMWRGGLPSHSPSLV
jgi:hypothetical protein